MTDPLPSFASLKPVAEFYGALEGPHSGGGRSVLVVGDRVYVVVYGDESTLPGGAEQVCASLRLDEAAQQLGAHRVWPTLADFFARRAAPPDRVLAVLGSTAWRHAYSLHALAVSPDGALVAGGGDDLVLWRSADGARVRRFEWPRGGAVRRLAFSVDGARLAAVHAGVFEVWSAHDGALQHRSERVVRALAPRPDGGFVLACEHSGALRLSRLAADLTETELGRLDHAVAACALSPDLAWFAEATDAAPGEVTLRALDTLAVARVWRGPRAFAYDVETRDFWGEAVTERHEDPACVRGLAFDATSTRVFVVGHEPIARCYALDRDAPLASTQLAAREAAYLAVHPTRAWVAIAQGPSMGGAGPATLWRADTDDAVTALGGSGPALAFAPDGSHLYVGMAGHRVVVHDGEGAPVARQERGDVPFALAATPDAETVFMCSTVALRAVATGDGVARWSSPRADWWEHALACTADGAELVMTANGPGGAVAPVLARVRTRDGAALPELGAAARNSGAVDVSPDGVLVASCGHDDDVPLRDVGGLVADVPRAVLAVVRPQALRFLPGGHGILVAQKSGELALFRWEGAPRGRIAAARVLTRTSPASSNAPNDKASALAVSRDGRRALSGFNDVVSHWDLDAHIELGASEPSTRFTRVLAVGFDRADVPRALLAMPTRDDERGEGTVILLWSAGATAEVVWSPSRFYLYEARALMLPDGARFVLVHDDGVGRVHPLAPYDPR
jgi:hypothetical protein